MPASALRRAAGIAGRLDLARSVGPRAALGHRAKAVRLARTSGAPREALYERIWREAAAELGAEVSAVPGGLRITRGARSTTVSRSATELDLPGGVRVSEDRRAAHAALTGAGLPVPEHADFRLARLRPALDFLARVSGPVVVKPAGGTGAGHGITCAVRTRSDLVRAAVAAGRFDDDLVVERQAPGSMYRLLVLDGKLIDVVRRDPPSVLGDGARTVAGLITAENERRLAAGGEAGLHLIRPDLDCLFTLRAAGLRLRSVLRAGRRVEVKTATSENSPSDNHVIAEPPHPAVTDAAVRAAAAAGLPLAGIDIVTADLARPLADAGGVILEVNASPGLHHHHLVADTTQTARVAVPILRRLLEEDH